VCDIRNASRLYSGSPSLYRLPAIDYKFSDFILAARSVCVSYHMISIPDIQLLREALFNLSTDESNYLAEKFV
jgi:hypothetical protein